MYVYSNYYKKKFYFFSSQSIRMSENSIIFGDKKIKQSDFYNKNNKIFNKTDIDVNKILVSEKEKYGKYNSFKYFIGYNDNDVIKPLYLELSQMTGYINKFNEHKNKNKNKNKDTTTMSLKVKDKTLFKNYNKIWKKIEKLMGIDFNTKPTYGDGDKYIKTKIKTYEDNVTTNFYNKEGSKKVPEEKMPHKCLSIIILDSVLYAYEKYHPQIFLEECKYMKENVKTKNYIDKELKSESDSNSDSDSDSDSNSGSNNEE